MVYKDIHSHVLALEMDVRTEIAAGRAPFKHVRDLWTGLHETLVPARHPVEDSEAVPHIENVLKNTSELLKWAESLEEKDEWVVVHPNGHGEKEPQNKRRADRSSWVAKLPIFGGKRTQ